MGRISAKLLEDKSEKKKPWNLTNKRFVCFLDIMGFKDLVMRNTHDKVYNLLDELSKYRTSLESAKSLPDGYDVDSLKTVSFSDTIVIFTKEDTKECFELLSFAASWLFAKALENGIPMKGAISYGEMSVNISRQIFFGQPLIDAYLLEEDVSFYGIAIHNTAEQFLNEKLASSICYSKYIDCLVPLKSGKINHYILDWVSALEEDDKTEITDSERKVIAINLMWKQRENTSGAPRKYIDNTIEVINHCFKD